MLKRLTDKGAHFWDYGNAFLRAVYDAGVPEITANGVDPSEGFIWPSYVEDIMGPMCFDYGYGPFRWVCLSGKPEDLHATDQAAMACIDPTRRGQDRDNWQWIHDAETNALVVGTQARILYADAEGRTEIARRFNRMVRTARSGPVMMGRDHHDTGGTDSPYRETANIYDGSSTVADMSHQCWAGNAARGMTMAVLSNGGGVGTGKADQRRFRARPRRFRTGRPDPRLGPRVGRHGRRRPPRVGEKRQRHRHRGSLERGQRRPRPRHRAAGRRRRAAGEPARLKSIAFSFPGLGIGSAPPTTATCW